MLNIVVIFNVEYCSSSMPSTIPNVFTTDLSYFCSLFFMDSLLLLFVLRGNLSLHLPKIFHNYNLREKIFEKLLLFIYLFLTRKISLDKSVVVDVVVVVVVGFAFYCRGRWLMRQECDDRLDGEQLISDTTRPLLIKSLPKRSVSRPVKSF